MSLCASGTALNLALRVLECLLSSQLFERFSMIAQMNKLYDRVLTDEYAHDVFKRLVVCQIQDLCWQTLPDLTLKQDFEKPTACAVKLLHLPRACVRGEESQVKDIKYAEFQLFEQSDNFVVLAGDESYAKFVHQVSEAAEQTYA